MDGVSIEIIRPCVATGLEDGAAEVCYDRMPWTRDRVRDRTYDACDCVQSARYSAHNMCVAVHATNLRLCTVLCTVWVTVHGHCSQTLFMGIVQRKKKKTVGN